MESGPISDNPPIPILRCLQAEDEQLRAVDGTTNAALQLGSSERVDARLRRRQLVEGSLSTVPKRVTDGEVLAHDDRGALWSFDLHHSNVETALLSPAELELDEPLRERMRARRFIALLPLIHLLRRITDYDRWTRPGGRAIFLFDDPNLHWPSYGHIRFADLARHAQHHGYHVAMSTVPLDCWFAHRSAVRTFYEAQKTLSLTVHGNDHLYQEFALPLNAADAAPIFDQALRRIRRFEARTGLHVSRVMVPPHGRCSDEMLDAMLLVGIEALCRAPAWWTDWAVERRRVARWTMADMSPVGGPIVGRHRLVNASARDEMTLNLFLDQPVVLYGHHYDLADGYDVLAETAAWLNDFGGIAWLRLDRLAQTNFMLHREENEHVRVRAFSRRMVVDVAAGVRSLTLEFPAYDSVDADSLLCDGYRYALDTQDGLASVSFPVSGAPRLLELRLVRQEVSPTMSRRGMHPRAVIRRGVGEFRDRLRPLVRRAGLETTLRRLEIAYDRRMDARVKARSRSLRDAR
jgi:hypothetical protein